MRGHPLGCLFYLGTLMHVPINQSLCSWIRSLIECGKLYRFYKTIEWLTLRGEVMEDHHNECEMCAKLGAYRQDSSGRWRRDERERYSRADTVHHEYEVKKHPEMALTRWVVDGDGTKREVLHPLCNRCHNEVHDRVVKPRQPSKKKFENVERW